MKPSHLRQALSHAISTQRPAFIWGPPGVGKSDLVRQVAEASGLELRDVRLSLLDPVDLKGFPVPNTAKKQMDWLAPNFLPKKGKGVLFLDEMTNAMPSIQAAAYQLVLDRKLGDYELPAGWVVIAAGNRTGDRSAAQAMPAALANRFVHLDYEVSNDDWDTWAMDNGVHPDIRGFMRFRPAMLHDFDPKANPRSFPSPRSWSFVDDLYKSKLPQDIEFEMIKGTVGEAAGAEFSGFTRLIKDLPTVEEVLLDPESARLPESPAAMYAISLALDAKTTSGNIGRAMQYMERLGKEFQVLFIRGAVRRDKTLTNTETFMDWVTANEGLLA